MQPALAWRGRPAGRRLARAGAPRGAPPRSFAPGAAARPRPPLATVPHTWRQHMVKHCQRCTCLTLLQLVNCIAMRLQQHLMLYSHAAAAVATPDFSSRSMCFWKRGIVARTSPAVVVPILLTSSSALSCQLYCRVCLVQVCQAVRVQQSPPVLQQRHAGFVARRRACRDRRLARRLCQRLCSPLLWGSTSADDLSGNSGACSCGGAQRATVQGRAHHQGFTLRGVQSTRRQSPTESNSCRMQI